MIYHVYAGSYMGEKGGDGIYLMELDTEEKTLRVKTSYPEVSNNPSFLYVIRDRVFAVSELEECGYITSFYRNPCTGELTRINRIKTEGTAMCHLCLWSDGRFISAANYMSGSLLVCSVDEEGRLGKICDFEQHEGVGFGSTARQEGPHMHSTVISRDGKRLYAADLGLDQIFCYEIRDGGKLALGENAMQICTPGGMGPRHFVFSDDGRFLYLMTEMGNQLFVYESKDGGVTFREIQNLSTLPEGFDGFNIGADIHFSSDGKFLYTSNRGVNDIAAFEVSKKTGLVKPVGHYSCFGDFPRNFCITPDDRFVIIANQKSGSIILCERNPETGALGGKLAVITIPEAVFVSAIEKERI